MTAAKIELRKQDLSLNQDFVCSITGGYFFEPAITDCNHCFEKEAIHKWQDEKSTKCPLCNHFIQSIKDDLAIKIKTEEFLLANIEHLPYRNFTESLRKKLKPTLMTTPEQLKLFSENLHLVFYVPETGPLLNVIYAQPLECIKQYFDALQKIPGLLKFALTWKNSVGGSGLSYSFTLGDIDKFNYILSVFDNDFSLFKKVDLGLHFAAGTRNINFFNYLLTFYASDVSCLLNLNQQGKTALMVACSQSTVEIVESILNLFKDATQEEIIRHISNQYHPDILLCASMNTISTFECFKITKQIQLFLQKHFSESDLKIFKQINKKRFFSSSINVISQALFSQQNSLKSLQENLESLNKRQRTIVEFLDYAQSDPAQDDVANNDSVEEENQSPQPGL